IGCRDLGARSLCGKVVASTLSIAGPLAAALFWRDAARARSTAAEQQQRIQQPQRYQARNVTPRTHEEEESHQARVADAIW
ncbi:unnamed protein product, partial [Hapterophycus canaliculatus]